MVSRANHMPRFASAKVSAAQVVQGGCPIALWTWSDHKLIMVTTISPLLPMRSYYAVATVSMSERAGT